MKTTSPLVFAKIAHYLMKKPMYVFGKEYDMNIGEIFVDVATSFVMAKMLHSTIDLAVDIWKEAERASDRRRYLSSYAKGQGLTRVAQGDHKLTKIE